MNNSNNIGDRLRELLSVRGIKSKELAILANTSPQTISKILNGKSNLSSKLAAQIAAILGTTTDYLLCKSDVPTDDHVSLQNFYGDFLNSSKQNFRISSSTKFLNDLDFTINEKVIVDDIVYTRHANLLFYETGEGLDSEYDENDIINLITSASSSPSHVVDIQYQDINKRLSYADYVAFINEFASMVQNFAHYLLQKNQTTSPIFSNNIDLAIEEYCNSSQKNPDSSNTIQHQKLLRALYGDNIPDNLKKEE